MSDDEIVAHCKRCKKALSKDEVSYHEEECDAVKSRGGIIGGEFNTFTTSSR
jgi:valyl-tRNA synthetase